MSLYVHEEGLQRVRFMTHQETESKNMALDTWDVSWSTRVLVQQGLVTYWSNLLWKENLHHVSHTIFGKSVCSNHCLLQFTVWVSLYQVENLFLIESIFVRFIRSYGNFGPSVKLISPKHSSSTTTTLSQFLNIIVGVGLI